MVGDRLAFVLIDSPHHWMSPLTEYDGVVALSVKELLELRRLAAALGEFDRRTDLF